MKGMNSVILVGNLGGDPEMKVLGEGLKMTRVTVATTEVFRLKNGELCSQTEWHTVIFWRVLAELAVKYLRKGSLVYVEGRLRTRSYEDAGGLKRHVTEVVANKLVMLDRRSGADPIDELFGDPAPF